MAQEAKARGEEFDLEKERKALKKDKAEMLGTGQPGDAVRVELGESEAFLEEMAQEGIPRVPTGEAEIAVNAMDSEDDSSGRGSIVEASQGEATSHGVYGVLRHHRSGKSAPDEQAQSAR